MRYIFFTLATAGCLSLAACSDEDEKARLFKEIVKRSALNDALKKKIIQSKNDKAALEAMRDSLSKSGDRLLMENNQLHMENNQLHKELKKTEQEVDEYRQKVSQLQKKTDQLQKDKRTNEREIRRLTVELDSISVDRDRLIGANQDFKNKLNKIKEDLNTLLRIHKSVRLLVGTESLLKSNRFLETVETGRRIRETSRRETQSKRYKLVKKLEGDDSRVKIVPLNQQLDLTLNSVPEALVNRSGNLKLKALVGRHGKLKEGIDYTVHKNSNTTIITFINRVLEGTGVLAVVEVKD